MSEIHGIFGVVVPGGSGRSEIAPTIRISEGRSCSHFVRDEVEVAFDGHIYSKHELGSHGSDAERFANLFNRHGFEGALQSINGDFAVALWNRRLGKLWLARDRFGVRPMYYVARPGFFAFGSRPRSFFGLPGVSSQPDNTFVALFAGSHYRHFDARPDGSPYKDIVQLPAAHFLEVVPAREPSIRRYWSLEDRADYDNPEEELSSQYRELLKNAVAFRFGVAESPVFTLSGGMDSSSVIACASANTGRRLPAISTVYEDPVYDESNEIRSMLGTVVEPWIPVSIGTPDIIETVEQMIEAHEEPVATATWLSHYLLCREARNRGYKAVFGGLGGDELNAGEYEYFFFFFADLRASGQEERLQQEVERWISYHNHPVFRKSNAVMEDGLRRLVDLTQPGQCLPDRARMLRYREALNPEFFDLERFEPGMDRVFTSFLKNRAFQDLFRETIPCCLRAEDRNTAAFGLDHFLPFLDHRLVEFMFRVPGRLKIRAGVTKHLLRRAMRGILPEETRTRIKKTGWNAPAHVWFSGSGRTSLLDLVRSQFFRERGIYNIPFVERIVEEHERIVSTGAPVDNHMMFLWQLVNMELWLRWLDRADSGYR